MYGDGWDPADEFATMGEEEFATVGYDEYGNPVLEEIGARATRPGGRGGAGDPARQARLRALQARRRRARPAAPRAPVVYPLLAPPGVVPQVPITAPGVAPGAHLHVTEPRVIELVNMELSKRLPAWFQGASRVPGSSDQAQLMSPLGLGVGTLTNAVNVVTLNAQPQRPFRGERLLVDLARSAGASVVPVRITEFKIGENSQLVGAGALPADAFDPQAFGVRLAMSPSAPGIQIVLRVETDTAAVPAGESISVTAAIIGRAVWGESGGPG